MIVPNRDDTSLAVDQIVRPVSIEPFLPTEATPGSEEKLRVLEDRHRKGLPLWHDLDQRRIVVDETDTDSDDDLLFDIDRD